MTLPAEDHNPIAGKADQPAAHCFGCGADNPQGLHLHFSVDATDPANITATCAVNLTRIYEGPPGYLHGGIIATLMDEAMSKLNRPLNVIAMTRHLAIDYLRPSPVGVTLGLIARHTGRQGRKLQHTAELRHPDGTILAVAIGLFVVIDPKRFAASR